MSNVQTIPLRESSRPSAPARRIGFTLIEILIVVVILGILAAIVIPQFSNASQTARENTLRDELRYLRTQILVYQAQHNDVSPGYPTGSASVPTEAAFLDQMTNFSNQFSATNATFSATLFPYGPYLSAMPPNSVNSKTKVTVIPNNASFPLPDGTGGFIYQPQTATIKANLTSTDTNGVAFSSY